MPAVTRSSLKRYWKSTTILQETVLIKKFHFLCGDEISKQINSVNMYEEMYWLFKIIDDFTFAVSHPLYVYTVYMPLNLAKSVKFLNVFNYCGSGIFQCTRFHQPS